MGGWWRVQIVKSANATALPLALALVDAVSLAVAFVACAAAVASTVARLLLLKLITGAVSDDDAVDLQYIYVCQGQNSCKMVWDRFLRIIMDTKDGIDGG